MTSKTPLRAWGDLAGWLLALAVVVAFGIGWRGRISAAVGSVMGGAGSGLSKAAFAVVGAVVVLALVAFVALVTRALLTRVLRRGN